MVWSKGPTSLFCMCKYPIVPEPLVDKTILSPIELSWHSSWKSIYHKGKSLFLDFQFYFIDLYVYAYTSYPVLIFVAM